jgi:hypothetical protein
VKRVFLLPAAVALTLGLAGCGGSTTYTLKATETCLTQRGAKISSAPSSDFVASTATGGAIKTTLSDNWVTIAFGQTTNGGVQLADAYQIFAHKNVAAGLPSVLQRYDNVVTLWHEHPQDSDLALVVGCLR